MGAVKQVSDPQFSYNSCSSSSHHPFPNGFHSSPVEMVALKTLTYTSLRDILPPEVTPEVVSPSTSRKQSWEEIPIKNPLVQKGAWAYLQPMTTARKSERRGVVAALKDRCGGCEGELGCAAFLNDVVFALIRRAVEGLFWERNETQNVHTDYHHQS